MVVVVLEGVKAVGREPLVRLAEGLRRPSPHAEIFVNCVVIEKRVCFFFIWSTIVESSDTA